MLHSRMLRYLDEVARSGSIRKAASRLNVAASAVNRQILLMEEEVGTPIFERMRGGLRLTATGEVLIAHVRDTLREHQRTLGRMAAVQGATQGEVAIATVGGLASGVLGKALGGFRSQHPRVKLTIRVLSRDAVVDAVLGGEAGIGLAYDLPVVPRLFRALDVGQPIGAVFAPGHPLAGRKVVSFADLAPYPIVMAERGMSLREAVDRAVPANVALSPIVETNSIELMKQFALSTPTVSFLSLIEIDEDLRTGRLAFAPLTGSSAQEVISVVHRASGPLDAAAVLVVHHLVRHFDAIGDR